MRGVCRIIVAVAAAAVMLTAMSSCGGAVRRRVAVEDILSVARLGLSGAEVELRVRNGLRRDIVLESCTLRLGVAAGELASAELRGGAVSAGGTCGGVRLRFRVSSVSPSAVQALWRRFAAGGIDDVTVDAEATVRIGRRTYKIYAAERNLSEILSNFGVSKEELSTWFQ